MFGKITFGYPNEKIEPADTQLILFDNSKPIIIYSNEEVEGFFGSREKQAYLLELKGNPSNITIQLVYFTNDVTIKTKGNFENLIEWDIDVVGRKGWNVLYENQSETKTTITTSGKGITDIKWVASKAGSF
jgi:hypothetical protein